VAAAAVDYFFAGGAGGEFDGSEDVEPFSSDGPRRVFYESDGTPITPGNLTSTGGELRSKPDLSGADGVSVAAPGFTPFFGTSAAAPHLAGLAALLIEHGSASAEDVRMAMEDSALDIEAAGFDRDSGHGIVEVVAASALLPEPGVTAMAFAGTLLLGRLGRRRR
jgi:subtilisin family serine protease